MADHQQLLIKQAVDSLNSSLSILESLSVLPPADAALIRSKLPVPNAGGSYGSTGPSAIHSPGGSLIDVGSSAGGGSSSPYPAPSYGQPSGGGAYRAPPPLPTRMTGLGEARATWDYEGSAADDLPFRKDEIIVITEESNADWWKGFVSSNSSRIGLFPSSYVSRLPNNPPPRPYSSSPAPSFQHNDHESEKYRQAYQSPEYPPPPHGYPQPPYGQQQPMVPYQQPYQPPPQQMVQHEQQQQQVAQVAPQKPPSKFDGMGRLLATSAVGGVGFGAGSAVGSGLINAIF